MARSESPTPSIVEDGKARSAACGFQRIRYGRKIEGSPSLWLPEKELSPPMSHQYFVSSASFTVCRWKRPIVFLVLISGLHAAIPTEYILTDITDWTPTQLAVLPHFDRYVPVNPVGAAADFVAVGANGIGLTAGTRNGLGVFVQASTQTSMTDWGSYRWSYWIWDGHDNHYYSGTVHHNQPRAVNISGQITGFANLSGGGSGVGSSSEYDDHIYLHDAATSEHLDLTPTAHRADPRDLNDRGEITGFWWDDTTYHPFRRLVDGTFIDFVYDEPFSHNISPLLINNHGHVAGMVTVWTTPRDYIPFFSASGSDTVALPYPDTVNEYNAGLADINDHDVIVGDYHKATTPLETTALRWTLQDGAWTAEKLVELLDDNMDFILDRAIAVNDAGHIICSGHADGGPDNAFNTHRFLLTPVTFAPPTVTTLSPVNMTATSVTLRAKINPANLPTTAEFQHGTSAAYGTNTALAPADGTLPSLAELPLTGLTPHTTYHYRAMATNAEVTTDGSDASFTTPWNWTSWASVHLGSTDPNADTNHNSQPDLFDYATGNGPAPTLTVEGDQRLLRFRRSLVSDGVTLIVQVSGDMSIWNNASSYSISESTPNTASTTEISREAVGTEA